MTWNCTRWDGDSNLQKQMGAVVSVVQGRFAHLADIKHGARCAFISLSDDRFGFAKFAGDTAVNESSLRGSILRRRVGGRLVVARRIVR
jgi:hypothetical protein